MQYPYMYITREKKAHYIKYKIFVFGFILIEKCNINHFLECGKKMKRKPKSNFYFAKCYCMIIISKCVFI